MNQVGQGTGHVFEGADSGLQLVKSGGDVGKVRVVLILQLTQAKIAGGAALEGELGDAGSVDEMHAVGGSGALEVELGGISTSQQTGERRDRLHFDRKVTNSRLAGY